MAQTLQRLQTAIGGHNPPNNAADSAPWGPDRKIDGVVAACIKWGGGPGSGKACVQRLTNLAADASLKPAMCASHHEVEALNHTGPADRAKLKGVEALFLLLTSTIFNAASANKCPKAVAVQRPLETPPMAKEQVRCGETRSEAGTTQQILGHPVAEPRLRFLPWRDAITDIDSRTIWPGTPDSVFRRP